MILSPPNEELLNLFFKRFRRTQQMKKMTPIAMATPATPTTITPASWDFERDGLFAEASAVEDEGGLVATPSVVEPLVTLLEGEFVDEIVDEIMDLPVLVESEDVLEVRVDWENEVGTKEVTVEDIFFVLE